MPHAQVCSLPRRHKVIPAAKAGAEARAMFGTSFHTAALVLWLASAVVAAVAPSRGAAQNIGSDAGPIRSRNMDVSRTEAAEAPRTEADQALAGGWPLYRTERGQAAFNDAMATLKATEGAAPPPAAFRGCADLQCNLLLPRVGADGWIPPGRIWISPSEYLLVAHSPRLGAGQAYRRRAFRDMQYFVLHEFQNSSRNTDLYDTISAHSGSVFVPLYMSKQSVDAKGRHFVVVVQVAPYDVFSIHASNKGSAGPGMEVAKNPSEALEPLQSLAGIVIASIVKAAAPQLQVVNHQEGEGIAMLHAYEGRLARLRGHPGSRTVALPFVPASEQRVAAATGRLGELIKPSGASAGIPVAERGIIPPGRGGADAVPSATQAAHMDMSSLAGYLRASAGGTVPTLVEPLKPAIRRGIGSAPVLVEPIRPAIRPVMLSPGDAD